MIMANYDQSGLRFPIQKLILGPRALKMFGSQENNRLVTHILSEKLYEYLSNTKISLEVNDGDHICLWTQFRKKTVLANGIPFWIVHIMGLPKM